MEETLDQSDLLDRQQRVAYYRDLILRIMPDIGIDSADYNLMSGDGTAQILRDFHQLFPMYGQGTNLGDLAAVLVIIRNLEFATSRNKNKMNYQEMTDKINLQMIGPLSEIRDSLGSRSFPCDNPSGFITAFERYLFSTLQNPKSSKGDDGFVLKMGIFNPEAMHTEWEKQITMFMQIISSKFSDACQASSRGLHLSRPTYGGHRMTF